MVSREEEVILHIQRSNGVDAESTRKAQDDPELGKTLANLQRMVMVTTELCVHCYCRLDRTSAAEHWCRLSNELYTKPAHCVMEIIQNADDNSYASGVEPELHIELRSTYMMIQCNELGFEAAHVRAFCGIRQSTKKNQTGYIGELYGYLNWVLLLRQPLSRREGYRYVEIRLLVTYSVDVHWAQRCQVDLQGCEEGHDPVSWLLVRAGSRQPAWNDLTSLA